MGVETARNNAALDDPGAQPIVRLNDLWVRVEHRDYLMEVGLSSLDALFALSDGEILTKPGLNPWRERLRVRRACGHAARTLYLKRFRGPPRVIRGEVRRSGCGARSVAGAEWAWGRLLASHGVPCADALAFGEAFRAGREECSAILLAEVPGRSLEAWVGDWRKEGRRIPPSVFSQTADLVARLHNGGFVHRDLYLSHFFYDSQAATAAIRLIDLQRMMRPRRMGRWIVKDLAALHFSTPAEVASNTDRLRWLRRYLGLRKLDYPAKRFALRVIGKTARIARRERRRQGLALNPHRGASP